MNGDRPSQTYQCCCQGCGNGHGSSFEAAPESWFKSRGYSLPKNCPDCRAWIKKQVDESVRCTGCGRIMRLSAELKISHHKKTRPWVLPTECLGCERGEKQAKSSMRRSPRHSTPKKLEPTTNQILPIISYDGLSDYRRVHFGKHVLDHPFSEVGQVRDDGGLVSHTTLVGPKSTSVEVYQAIDGIAERTDTDIYQYREGDTVFKVTIVNDVHVELTIFRKVGSLYEPITSYDQVTISEVQGKLKNLIWS